MDVSIQITPAVITVWENTPEALFLSFAPSSLPHITVPPTPTHGATPGKNKELANFLTDCVRLRFRLLPHNRSHGRRKYSK